MKRKGKASSVKRGQKFFPGLSGLQAKINEVSEPVTDRGLTGPAARDAEDAQARIAKRQAKLARRAKQAKSNNPEPPAFDGGSFDGPSESNI